MDATEHPMDILVRRYPQLSLDAAVGMSASPAYKAIALGGCVPDSLSHRFSPDPRTRLERVDTPAGSAEVLYLPVREDFVRFVQAMAYRLEPKDVPPSMGAVTIRNINNWRKIEAHRREYEAAGNADWMDEFKRFTAVPENYRDTIIALSGGPYSALPCQMTPFSQEEWLNVSLTIRKYHELAHFISGRLFPENREALRDEVIADAIGIIAATGGYDMILASRSLGIESETYREGGRLQNYAKDEAELANWALRARVLVSLIHSEWSKHKKEMPFAFLMHLEKERVGI